MHTDPDTDKHHQLLLALVRLVRLDTVGPSLQPDLVSASVRNYPDGRTGRYPGSTLTLSPPKLVSVEQQATLVWRSTALLSWAFPGYKYSQLPAGHAANLVSRLVARLPRAFRIVEAETGAQQLDGSNVWCLLAKLIIEWPQAANKDADVSELQPSDFGKTDPPEIQQVSLGLWRSPLPLDPDNSTLDVRINLTPEQP